MDIEDLKYLKLKENPAEKKYIKNYFTQQANISIINLG